MLYICYILYVTQHITHIGCMKFNSRYDRRGGFWAKRLSSPARNRTPFWDLEVAWNRNEWDKRANFWDLVLPEAEKISHAVMFA